MVLYRFHNDHYLTRKRIVDKVLSMTLRVRAEVLLHVWSYDFYDTMLFTELQRRHMINRVIIWILLGVNNVVRAGSLCAKVYPNIKIENR